VSDELSFGAYPMVDEGQATGRVAGVFADLLSTGMPFVPSLFKSLALCPPYLVLAHDQVRSVLPGPASAEAAQHLARGVRDAVEPPRDPEVREHLARFVEPSSQMLLASAGLLEALEGGLTAPAARDRRLPVRPVRPQGHLPATDESPDRELYGRIRAGLGTPVVNSAWRSLSAAGHLRAAWSALEPQLATALPVADQLQGRARAAARALPWGSAASPQALAAHGVEDAAPGMRSVLRTYLLTLSRLLVLTACAAQD